MSGRCLGEDAARPLFSPGQRVKHSIFGLGTVVDADRSKGAHIVQFDDMPTPRAISFRARLEEAQGAR